MSILAACMTQAEDPLFLPEGFEQEDLFIPEPKEVVGAVEQAEKLEQQDPINTEMQALALGFEKAIQKEDFKEALRLFNPTIRQMVEGADAYQDFFQPILPEEGCALRVAVLGATGTDPDYTLVLKLTYHGCPLVDELVWVWKVERVDGSWVIQSFSDPDTPRQVSLDELPQLP